MFIVFGRRKRKKGRQVIFLLGSSTPEGQPEPSRVLPALIRGL